MQRDQPSLPPWGDDVLSSFIADANHNERACALNFPDVYEVLQGAHEVLKRVGEILEKDPADANLGVPRMLVARSRSAVLAATRLAMSGQGFEAQPLLRAAIEQAWYALHIAKDPQPPTRALIWWDRGTSPEATQACKDEFTAGNVRRTHEGVDPATAAAMHQLYGDAIDFGAHPNQAGVAGSLNLDRGTSTVGVGFPARGDAGADGGAQGCRRRGGRRSENGRPDLPGTVPDRRHGRRDRAALAARGSGVQQVRSDSTSRLSSRLTASPPVVWSSHPSRGIIAPLSLPRDDFGRSRAPRSRSWPQHHTIPRARQARTAHCRRYSACRCRLRIRRQRAEQTV
jgi:hypothetical protein